jgi:hypothetical protein
VKQPLLHLSDWLSMVRCIYMPCQCGSSEYPAELRGAIGAVIPALVELISRSDSPKVTSTMVHLTKHGTLRPNINDTCLICEVGLHIAIGGTIPQLLRLFTYSYPAGSQVMHPRPLELISSSAAALICTLAKHCESFGL